MNAAERALIPQVEGATTDAGPVPWQSFLTSRHGWLLFFQYFFLSYGAFFYITWLSTYLEEARGVHLAQGAFLAAFPLFFAGLGSLFCGFFLSRLALWVGGAATARRILAVTGFLGSCVFLILSTRIHNKWLAMTIMGLAGFCNDLAMPPSWGASMDLGGKHAGTLSAGMNMGSCIGAAVSAWITGVILERSGNQWNYVLYAGAAAYFIGGCCWLFLDPVTPLNRGAATSSPAAPSS